MDLVRDTAMVLSLWSALSVVSAACWSMTVSTIKVSAARSAQTPWPR